MRNDDVLKLVKTVNDIALGAPISTDMIADLKQWVRLEEEHGSSPAVTAIVKALLRELEEARAGQVSITGGETKTTTSATSTASTPKRAAKREVPEDPPAEDPPTGEAALGEEEEPAGEAPVEPEDEQEKPAAPTDEW